MILPILLIIMIHNTHDTPDLIDCKKVRLMMFSSVASPKSFSDSPGPLGTKRVSELIGTWMGLGLGGFGAKSLGPGLENISGLSFILKLPIPIRRTKAGTSH